MRCLEASIIGLSAGAMLAQAAANDTAFEGTLYGVAHVSLDSVSNTFDDDTEIASNSSRIGIKGRYQLSDYVSIIGQIEQGLDLTGDGVNDGNGPGDTGSIFSRARDSFIGFETKWGTIKYGRQGFLNQWIYDYNLFADQIGDLGNIWGGTGFAGRGDNAISYETPSFGGLKAIVLHTVAPADTNDDKVTTVKVHYEHGGLVLGAGYGEAQHKLANREDYTISSLTARYTFEGLKWNGLDLTGSSLGAGLQYENAIAGVAGNDRDGFNVGGSLELNGNHKFKLQYTDSDSRLDGFSANQLAVGYDYKFNKYMTLYAAYADIKNEVNASFLVNNYGHGRADTVALGDDPTAISVGLILSYDCKFTSCKN